MFVEQIFHQSEMGVRGSDVKDLGGGDSCVHMRPV